MDRVDSLLDRARAKVSPQPTQTDRRSKPKPASVGSEASRTTAAKMATAVAANTTQPRDTLNAVDLSNGHRGESCAPYRRGATEMLDRSARQGALNAARRQADLQIGEVLWSELKGNFSATNSGAERDGRLEVSGVAKSTVSTSTFFDARGRSLVVDLPGSARCEANECCVTRILPIEDATAAIDRELKIATESFRSHTRQALMSDTNLARHKESSARAHSEVITQLYRRRAIDKSTAVRLSDADQGLWDQLQTKIHRHKAAIHLSYGFRVDEQGKSGRTLKTLMTKLVRGLNLSAPTTFRRRADCHRKSSHALVLNVGETERRKSLTIRGMFIVSVELELLLLDCKNGEELASLPIPEEYTGELTPYGFERSERILWSGLTGDEHGPKLSDEVREFVSEELGL